jgi:YggT family protein
MGLIEVIEVVARAVAVALPLLAGVVALTHWAVRRRYLAPMGGWSKAVRKASDPVLRPIEGRLVRSGGNPQDATLWLFGGAVILGLLTLGVVRWIFGILYTITLLPSASPGTAVRLVIGWAFGLVMTAIVIRVIAGWLGASPYSKWMRPLAWLTDWIITPIRRRLPPFGPIDLSPVVAYLLLWLIRGLLAV